MQLLAASKSRLFATESLLAAQQLQLSTRGLLHPTLLASSRMKGLAPATRCQCVVTSQPQGSAPPHCVRAWALGMVLAHRC